MDENNYVMKDNRFAIVDVGKGLGILFLFLFTHNFWCPDIILNIDGYILMPFFFFLSGLVFTPPFHYYNI